MCTSAKRQHIHSLFSGNINLLFASRQQEASISFFFLSHNANCSETKTRIIDSTTNKISLLQNYFSNKLSYFSFTPFTSSICASVSVIIVDNVLKPKWVVNSYIVTCRVFTRVCVYVSVHVRVILTWYGWHAEWSDRKSSCRSNKNSTAVTGDNRLFPTTGLNACTHNTHNIVNKSTTTITQ